jgi:hypothetical protein
VPDMGCVNTHCASLFLHMHLTLPSLCRELGKITLDK